MLSTTYKHYGIHKKTPQPKHICRLVDDVVENIDLKSIEGRYDGPGSPAYHPKVMMKLTIQGTPLMVFALIERFIV
jgi:hypothetical protein